MSANVKVHKRGLLVVATTLCVIYTAHVTLSILYQFKSECQVVTLQKSGGNDRVLDQKPVLDLNNDEQIEASRLTDPLASLNRTDYFNCEDFDKIPKTTQAIKENTKGNRGISFIKVQIDGIVTYAVYKEANR